MDQFETVFLGGYRKDLVDERLKELVAQIEELRKGERSAKEREERLKEELAAALSRAEAAESLRDAAPSEPDGDTSQREEQLKEELAAALERLNVLEEELECGGTRSVEPADGKDQQRKEQLKEELAAALRWSESLEAELKLARDEKDARTQSRLLELERTKALNQRILDLEEELEEVESEHRRELARLQEQLDHQTKSSAATERILAMAEEEARTLIEEAQDRAQELERQTEADVRAKKQAAAQALEGARTQVIRYLDAFNATRNKLAVTYDELDALVDQIPRTDTTVIELEHGGEGGGWSYMPDARK